jgi:hypothetical protein
VRAVGHARDEHEGAEDLYAEGARAAPVEGTGQRARAVAVSAVEEGRDEQTPHAADKMDGDGADGVVHLFSWMGMAPWGVGGDRGEVSVRVRVRDRVLGARRHLQLLEHLALG